MVSLITLSAVLLIIFFVEANVTKISKENVLLSRRKRYLNFPMGSNFVITMSHIKLLLQVQPRGWAILLEADVPFALPTDTRQLFKKTKRHALDRDNILKQMEIALSEIGLNGETCIRKMICAILESKKTQNKSLVKDLLYAAFVYPEENFPLDRDKCNASSMECSVALFE